MSFQELKTEFLKSLENLIVKNLVNDKKKNLKEAFNIRTFLSFNKTLS